MSIMPRIPFFSFTSGILVGLFVAAVWLSGNLPALPAIPFPGAEPEPTGEGVAAPYESSSLSIAPQSAGARVLVESVTVPPPGVWVAVREVSGKDLGNVLGAQKVNGPRTNVSVPLLRSTEAGNRYAVEVYRDDGDGIFNAATDSVYVDLDTGLPAVSYFEVTK